MKIEEALDLIINTDYSLFTDEKASKAFDMALFALSVCAGVKKDVSKLESLDDPIAGVLAASYGRMIEEIEKIGGEDIMHYEELWDRLYNWLNDMRFSIAPDETVTDAIDRNDRLTQVDLLDEIMEWMVDQEEAIKNGK